jgi:hypothetical protein
VIASVDTYLANELEAKLQIILSNRYIIEEILKGVQPNIATNFINAYTGDTAREIPIVYAMPQDKQTQQGAIYIGLREGEETDPSIGFMESTFNNEEGGLNKDQATIQALPDNSKCYLEVTKPIGKLWNVDGMIFAKTDNMTIEGNRIYFAYDSSLVGVGPLTVYYDDTLGAGVGTKQGFTTTEHYSVLAVSTNMDTVRCLDLLIKAILIMMRSNPEEQSNNLLQRIQFGQVAPQDTGSTGSDGTPILLYGRETVVSYKVSYNLENALSSVLNSITVNLKSN